MHRGSILRLSASLFGTQHLTPVAGICPLCFDACRFEGGSGEDTDDGEASVVLTGLVEKLLQKVRVFSVYFLYACAWVPSCFVYPTFYLV